MRHIPSEQRLYSMLSGVLEKARSYPGQVPGEDSVRFNVKQLRAILVAWRDGKMRSQEMLSSVDRILDGHGVEHLRSVNGRAEAYYVNMGDPYRPTLLLDLGKDRVWTTDWGTWVETEERRGNAFA